jgi:TonB family protein
LQPVEIVFKPRPVYTPEARSKRVEGEVLLEVVFGASGSLHISRVVKELGYGLDDAAVAAAQHIQFRPARRDGQPYDCAALVHIKFELSE